jgi:F-type H+-transporting ATPase subunit b
MSSQEKSSSGSWLINLIVGVVLMVGGTYVSVNHVIPTEGLAKQGIDLDLGMTIATIGVFLVLFPAVKYFFLTDLEGAINHRNQELEQTFSDAENLRAEMQKMRNDYEKRLADTEASARDAIKAQIAEAQNLRQTLMAEAAARADEMITRAEQEIEAEKARALTDIRLHVVDLTLAATEKILGETVNADVNRRLINEFIDKVEVAP